MNMEKSFFLSQTHSLDNFRHRHVRKKWRGQFSIPINVYILSISDFMTQMTQYFDLIHSKIDPSSQYVVWVLQLTHIVICLSYLERNEVFCPPHPTQDTQRYIPGIKIFIYTRKKNFLFSSHKFHFQSFSLFSVTNSSRVAEE